MLALSSQFAAPKSIITVTSITFGLQITEVESETVRPAKKVSGKFSPHSWQSASHRPRMNLGKGVGFVPEYLDVLYF